MMPFFFLQWESKLLNFGGVIVPKQICKGDLTAKLAVILSGRGGGGGKFNGARLFDLLFATCQITIERFIARSYR